MKAMNTKKALKQAIKALHQQDGFAPSLLDALKKEEKHRQRFSQHMLLQLESAMKQTEAL